MKENPFIQIDFKNETKAFYKPVKIIKTYSLQNVISCLEKVEKVVNDGYYVAGFLSYEASPAFNQTYMTKRPNQMPLLWFGVFNEPKTTQTNTKQRYEFKNWKLAITKKQFEHIFNKAQRAIRKKKISQVNYTTRYHTHFSGNPYAYYNDLKDAQQADYSAYIQTDDFNILSVSPELFFEIDHNTIKTKPMKGTIERGLTYREDLKKKMWLKQSEKNRYENELATKLMCHELKHITKRNSLHIDDQFKVKQYPTLYQMTSTIKGTLRNSMSLKTIFKTLFPCTSITGTPKDEAIKLISELEQSPRNIYCGTIGYMTPTKKAIFNVPIRTVFIDQKQNRATYGVGGAITDQSMCDEEFNEIITKAKVLQEKRPPFELLETIGLIDGKYLVLNKHLARLEQSAKYFNFPIDIKQIKRALLLKQKKYDRGKWRLRLLVNNEGLYKIEVHKLTEINDIMPVTLAKKPIQKNNPFLYHKTTNRTIYGELKSKNDHYFDTLLWNEEGEITEFTIGNVVVELNEKMLTPPVKCGLLPGTYREKLLKEKTIKEKPIYIEDLANCTHIWLINSVRQWIEVTL